MKDPEARKKHNAPIPSDFTREEMATKFRDAVRKAGLHDSLQNMIVVLEPHKKWKPDRSGPEMHFHICFKMRKNFAHKSICEKLADNFGCKGHMSVPRKGWGNLVKYVLQDSAVKLPVHMDQNPVFWPDDGKNMTKELMLEKVAPCIAAEDAEETKGKTTRKQKESKPKKKKTLDFAQFTDWIVMNNVTNEAQFWQLAGKEKEHNDNPTLWNYAGQVKVDQMIQKAIKGHKASVTPEVFQFASRTGSPFPLTAFEVPESIRHWMKHDSKKKSLIISGRGGIGKTQMAMAICSSLGPYFFVDSLDTIKNCLFVGGETLILDDVTLATFDIDNCKSFLDTSCDRALKCRHIDAMVPRGTRRIFLTNHEKYRFFPAEFQMRQHSSAIERRMLWVECESSLFNNKEISVFDIEKEAPSSGEAASSAISKVKAQAQSAKSVMSKVEVQGKPALSQQTLEDCFPHEMEYPDAMDFQEDLDWDEAMQAMQDVSLHMFEDDDDDDDRSLPVKPASEATPQEFETKNAAQDEVKSPEIAPAALAPVALAPAASQDTASTAVVEEHAAKVQDPDQCYATVQDEVKNPESEIDSRRSALSEIRSLRSAIQEASSFVPQNPDRKASLSEKETSQMLRQRVASPQMNTRLPLQDILQDPYRRRPAALGSCRKVCESHLVEQYLQSKQRDQRLRTRSPRWGSSHKVNRDWSSRSSMDSPAAPL